MDAIGGKTISGTRTHEYECSLEWEGDPREGTLAYARYTRDYRINIEGKAPLDGSADPAFRGDPGKHNPEDLLIASLSACHMLSYLAICARHKIRVLEYVDSARGVMTTTSDGGGHFESVVLHPRVVIAEVGRVAEADSLHELAHSQCFIASSCNFPIDVEAEVISA